jgi:hypothetical protein
MLGKVIWSWRSRSRKSDGFICFEPRRIWIIYFGMPSLCPYNCLHAYIYVYICAPLPRLISWTNFIHVRYSGVCSSEGSVRWIWIFHYKNIDISNRPQNTKWWFSLKLLLRIWLSFPDLCRAYVWMNLHGRNLQEINGMCGRNPSRKCWFLLKLCNVFEPIFGIAKHLIKLFLLIVCCIYIY